MGAENVKLFLREPLAARSALLVSLGLIERKINCLVRSPQKLAGKWAHLDHVRIHQGDLSEKESLYPSGNPSI